MRKVIVKHLLHAAILGMILQISCKYTISFTIKFKGWRIITKEKYVYWVCRVNELTSKKEVILNSLECFFMYISWLRRDA